MRPPGYVRRLPFDSLDHLLAAAGIDREAWHGLHLIDDDRAEAFDDFRTNRYEERLVQLAEPGR